MRIALIGGRDFQQFPIISYGGIETCVENLAWGLHKAQKDFVCIVPKRQVVQDYPFEVIESKVPPLPGPEANVWPFANSLPDIVKAVKPDVIWSQCFWSAETLKGLGIPIICTFHDFVPDIQRKNAWFTHRENTWYRFISRFQFDQWVKGVPGRLRDRSFHLHTGLTDEEYQFGPVHERGDHCLWVAGLNWGWHIKGLDLFIELAKRHPHKAFIAYGTGNRDIEERLKEFNRTLGNFEFRGALKRGEAHRIAFARARLFLMPTQMPEPLGRTVIESMSKGTPVLGSTNGALPELIRNGVSGYTARTLEEYERYLDAAYDYAACFKYARRFHISNEINIMIERSSEFTHAGTGNAVPGVTTNGSRTAATVQQHPISIEALLSDALQRHQTGDLANAERLYNTILMRDPLDADALNLLGVLCFQRRRLSTAKVLILKAIRINPHVAEFYLNLGDVLYGQGQRESAAETYNKCLALNPDMQMARERLMILRQSSPLGETLPRPLERFEVAQALLACRQGRTYLEVGIDSGEMFTKIRAKRKFGVDPVPTSKLINTLLEKADIGRFKYRTDQNKTTRIHLEACSTKADTYLGRDEDARIYYTTSDTFFAQEAARLFGQTPIDLAFLDGLHTHDQTYKDLLNTLEFLAEDGFILIHDCNPPVASSAVPAQSWQAAAQMNLPDWTGMWCGDVWKCIVRLRAMHKDLNVFVLDYDYGIAVVSRGRPENMLDLTPARIDQLTFADLIEDREMLLNLKPQEYLFEFMKNINIRKTM